MKKALKKIVILLFDMIITVIFYGTFLWGATNLLSLAFGGGYCLTYLQALAIDFFICVVLECFSQPHVQARGEKR